MNLGLNEDHGGPANSESMEQLQQYATLLCDLLGKAYERMKSNPEQAHEIAMDLRKTLEEF